MSKPHVISCEKCNCKAKLELPEDDDWELLDVRCSKCGAISWIARVTVE